MPCANKPIPMDGLVTCIDSTMTFNVTKFDEVYPEFAKLPVNVVFSYGLVSINLLRECSFGTMFQYAVGLLTAHRLASTYDLSQTYSDEGKKDLSSTEVGTNISASTGSLSQGSTPLALIMGDDPFVSDLARTSYGLELLALIRTWIPGADLVSGKPIGRFLYSLQWPPVNSGY